VEEEVPSEILSPSPPPLLIIGSTLRIKAIKALLGIVSFNPRIYVFKDCQSAKIFLLEHSADQSLVVIDAWSLASDVISTANKLHFDLPENHYLLLAYNRRDLNEATNFHQNEILSGFFSGNQFIHAVLALLKPAKLTTNKASK